MPQSLKFTGKTGDSIEISKFGTLLSWVTIDGLDRIAPTGQNARKPRDGYAFLYGNENNPTVIYDVGCERTPGLTSKSLSSNAPTNNEIAPGTEVKVTAVVEDAQKVFRITHVFTWKVGRDKIDVNRTIENISSSDVLLIAVKSHSALLPLIGSSSLASKSATRMNGGGLSLTIYDPDRGPCPAPPPDDCFSLEFSSGPEAIKMDSLVATPTNPNCVDFKTDFLGAYVKGASRSSIRRLIWTSSRKVKDWQVTLGRRANKTLSNGQSFSFNTHYRLHQGLKTTSPQCGDALVETVVPPLSGNESQPEAIGGVQFDPPGNLEDFESAARQEWNEKLRTTLQRAVEMSGAQHLVVAPSQEAPDFILWRANPEGVNACLKDQTKAMKLADWNSEDGDMGRILCHEEYLEWRTVRNSDGKIVRVEMTTELQEYWITLARHHPEKLLSLVAEFAGEASARPEDVYGTPDPYSLSLDEREEGFCEMMLPGDSDRRPALSPYNNGKKAICFLSKERNAFAAAVKLISASSFPFARMVAGHVQSMKGEDIILNRFDAAFRRRALESTNSDPTIVGNIAEQALNGNRIALDNPPGIYIRNVLSYCLQLPNGDQMPASWLRFERGSGPGRFQRLIFSAPSNESYVVGDLMDSQTGEKIEFGYQLAKLVEVAIYYRVVDKIDSEPIILGSDRCGFLDRSYSAYESGG